MKRFPIVLAACLAALGVSAAESDRLKAAKLNADRQCERANLFDKSKAALAINRKCVDARKQLADVAYEEKTAAFDSCMKAAKTPAAKTACDNAEIAARKHNEGYQMNASMGEAMVQAAEREAAGKK